MRNTWKKADGWLKEESDGGFPFIIGKQHVVEFVAQKEKIEVCLGREGVSRELMSV